MQEIIDATPEDLCRRPGGMYDELAVEMCGGKHERVSLCLLLTALAQCSKPGGCDRILGMGRAVAQVAQEHTERDVHTAVAPNSGRNREFEMLSSELQNCGAVQCV